MEARKLTKLIGQLAVVMLQRLLSKLELNLAQGSCYSLMVGSLSLIKATCRSFSMEILLTDAFVSE